VGILIGTSGFSYDDWKGHFYPPGIRKGEMLSYYARVYPTVEINSTYYGMPHPATMYQMTRKVPDGFDFVVKAHQSMTHSDRFQPESFEQFRQALVPLREAGMLGAVLAQFPHSFRPTIANDRYLEILRNELPDVPVVVEFRNGGWVREQTSERLRTLGLAYCCVDEPRLHGLMPPVVQATAPLGYVRFHGRNAEKWWTHAQAFERYDYLYREEELKEWVPGIRQLAEQTEKTYVFFNNCHESQASVNATAMARLLQIPLPEPPPLPGETQGALAFGGVEGE
jgi:uncharacterized protein YecE (DUF72 family)